MKSIFVSIVDVLGIFIPGFLLLLGIVLIPISAGHSQSYKMVWQLTPELVRTNATGLAVTVIIASYAVGFIIRLASMGLLQTLTKKWWAARLTKQAEALHPVFEECLNYPELCSALKDAYGSQSMGHITGYAAYFSFAKRIIRNGSPSLWAEAERIEAEMRFSAGLFIPFCALALNGLLSIRSGHFGWMLLVLSLCSCFIILYTFPRRRIREILHLYTMAIVTLRSNYRTKV
jgi:hypothetical protein